MSFSGGTEGIFDDEALENVDHVETVTSRHSEDFSANTQNRLDRVGIRLAEQRES